MGLDLPDYLRDLGQEKFRAVILQAPPEKSPELTKFARKLRNNQNSSYLDVLAHFQADEELAAGVDRFGPEHVRNLLIEQSKGTDLLIVDHLDFLLDAWRKEERQAFYRMVQRQWNSFLENTRATLVFCLQTSAELEDLQITDTRGRSRVLSLSELKEIL